MSRKSLIFYGESAGIRTQDPRLKRAPQALAIGSYRVRLNVVKALTGAGLIRFECDGFILSHIADRDQNRDRTVTKTVTTC